MHTVDPVCGLPAMPRIFAIAATPPALLEFTILQCSCSALSNMLH